MVFAVTDVIHIKVQRKAVKRYKKVDLRLKGQVTSYFMYKNTLQYTLKSTER